jgi:hypothetical protein
MRRASITITIGLASLLAAAACGGGGGGGTALSTVAIAATVGDNQTGTVGTALAPIEVTVTDNGVPDPGVSITWSANGIGSGIAPGLVTDGNGKATAIWTLGTLAGTQTATATLLGASGSPVTFHATATAGPATTLGKPVAGSGDGQSGPINSALANPLVALASDQFGNPVQGVQISWIGNDAAPDTPGPAPTDVNGRASTTVTMGPTQGLASITATSNPVLTGSPLTFNLTATPPPPPPPSSITINVGPDIRFTSVHNGTTNPAVDTVAVGGTVTWHWQIGSILHSVESTDVPAAWTVSTQMTSGDFPQILNNAGTYEYDCGIHGPTMSGRIIVR